MNDLDVVCESGPDTFVKVVDGIDNGSFEVSAPACSPTFDLLADGSGILTDWTIVEDIFLVCGLWDNADGSASLGMSVFAAGGDGEISQDIVTTPGRNYELRFQMAGNTLAGPDVKDLDVTVAGNVLNLTESFSFDISSDCGGPCATDNMGWTEKIVAFTADSAVTTISFLSQTLASNAGPTLDDVMLFEDLGGIAVAVEAPQTESLHYDFKITARTDGLTDPVVFDTVPAEWDVDEIDGETVGNENNEDRTGATAPGLACGQSDTVEGVDLSRGGKPTKKCHSDTDLVWDLDPDVTDMIRVDLQSRMKNRPKMLFSPTSCGALFLNHGAVLLDGITPIAETGKLCVAAVKDIDGGGVMGDGTGDEDNDNLDDFDEACTIGTDPCLADTDGDGVQDDVDNCPLEGPPGAGEINVGGCNEPEPT